MKTNCSSECSSIATACSKTAGGFGFSGPGAGPGGGPGGFGGGGGPIAFGRMGRGFDINKPHGFLYVQDDNAGLDADPYSLSGREAQKASYNTLRFGAFVGGPLKIPKLFDFSKSTFYSVGWNGTRGSTPYDQFSTVPTVAERGGILGTDGQEWHTDPDIQPEDGANHSQAMLLIRVNSAPLRWRC